MSGSAAAVAHAVAPLRPVSLDEVLERAALQTRTDTKFIVYPAVFDRLLALLGPRLDVLEIEGRRQFGYESTYFDTPDLRSYRDHLQGRRRRFKIRTRTYVDSGECCFEIKLEGRRESTVKVRSPHPAAAATVVTPQAADRLHATLTSHGLAVPSRLIPTLSTSYQRTTLVGRDDEVRITCDVDLTCSDTAASRTALRDRVLIEVKSARASDPVLRRLTSLGARPVSISKYCAAIAMLHPELPCSPWLPVLRKHLACAGLRRQPSLPAVP